MWNYISGLPKVVEEKKKEKNPKAACDSKGSKEYEKIEQIEEVFSEMASWPVMGAA